MQAASFGDPQADALRWPLDRDEALADLDAFVTHALPWFGQFQDAMSTRAPRLFHSLLSFALNTKMLRPAEVIARAETAWREGRTNLLQSSLIFGLGLPHFFCALGGLFADAWGLASVFYMMATLCFLRAIIFLYSCFTSGLIDQSIGVLKKKESFIGDATSCPL